jgi:WD40 repeat protein
MAMKCDLTSLAVGLEDGSLELWERVGQSEVDESKLSRVSQPFKRLGPLEGHSDLIRVVDLSPDYIISGSWDASIRLWCRKSGKNLAFFSGSEGAISGIHLNQNEKCVLFSGRSGKVKKLWITGSGCGAGEDIRIKLEPEFEIDHGDCIIDMSVDKTRILTGGSDARLLLWNFSGRKYTITMQRGCRPLCRISIII